MADCPAGKSSWPELVGQNGEAAAAVIEKQNPNVDAIVLPPGSMVTFDFRCDRVWVWVNESGVVYQTPFIG
ncbi:proteinase inhibitor [Phtheirospermum japonicum]|uniref:Proteinase inhibitor n=1 Tax=Phtheirospermum japonicum TaxID=374723 RepID=A0A830BLS1_9LAMI|nr:proteinase inhibitor [Phtheirospermum japonicum]